MRRHVAALLVVLGACVVFQAWFLGLTPRGVKLGDPKLSDAYTEALAHGQSYLLATPDPSLVAAKDPFGPATAALMISDTSYFRGHFYMYFGIVPFLTFLVPWRLATGVPPSPELTLLVFSLLGYAAYCSILLLALKRCFKQNSSLVTAMACLTIVVASGTWPLMGRPAIYEIENAAAYASFAFSLLALARYEWSEDRPLWALALSTACAALVMGCRPNYFPAVTILVIWAAYRGFWGRKGQLALRIVPVLPITVIGLGLAWWNFHRFGDIFDFGLAHTVSADPTQIRPLATWANLPYHLHRYALGLPRLERYFPFIQGQQEGPFPVGEDQEVSNQVYGFLIISPIILFFPALFLGQKREPCRLAFCWIALAAFVGNFALLSSITMSCYRYPADFSGPLSLLTALAILRLASSSLARNGIPQILVASILLWCVVGEVLKTFSTAQNTELFDKRRPGDFESVAGMFNRLIYQYDRLADVHPHTIELDFMLPKGRIGTNEPIMVLGEKGAQDFFYIFIAGPNLVRIGFESEGQGGKLSNLESCDFETKHTIEISLGMLLPPPDDPIYSRMSVSQIQETRSIVLIKLDGQVVFDGNASLHARKGLQYFGRSPDNPAFGSRFEGQFFQASSANMPLLVSPARWDPHRYGKVTLRVTPANLPVGVLEPILTLGYHDDGAELLIKHGALDFVSFVWVTTRGANQESRSFKWSPSRTSTVVIACGSLYPGIASDIWPPQLTEEQRVTAKSSLKIKVDNDQIWSTSILPMDASPESWAYGRDTLSLIPNIMPTSATKQLAIQMP